MKLSLSKKLLLLAIDDNKGTMISDQMHLHYGLAGAILLEMALMEKIRIVENKLQLMASGSTKDPVINQVINLIKKSEKSRKIKYWIVKIGQKGGKLKKEILKSLIHDGILRKEENRILWIIPYNKYPTVNAKPENYIRKELHEIVLHNKIGGEENLMLLSLVQACNLIKEVFNRKEEYKIAKQKIKELTSESQIGKVVDETIQGVQAAIMIAVMTSTIAATTAATSS